MKVMQRFLRNRGVGKFRRNRMAMGALAIIAVYFLIAGWIIVMESVDWVGRQTGAWRLRDTPVAGALLPAATLERVGPRWVAGFGMKQNMARRLDQADLMLAPLRQALDEIERNQFGYAEAAPVLADVRFAERRVIDAPPSQIAEMYRAAAEQLADLDIVKHRRGTLERAKLISERALDLADRLPRRIASDGWEGASRLRDDAAAAVEDAMFALEDYLSAAAAAEVLETEAGALAELDALVLQGSVDRLLEPEPPEVEEGEAGGGPVELIPVEMLRQLRAEAAAAVVRMEADVDGLLNQLEASIAELYPMPTGAAGAAYTLRTWLGTDAQGRSIFVRGVYSAKVAVQVGFITALISVIFGALLGAAAAFFGGWVDHGVQWLYSTFSSVPNLVLLVVLAFMFTGSKVDGTLIPVYAAFCMTFWIGPCRVIRGEVMKVKELEYVQAARATGFGRAYILLKHVIPNTTHLMFISFSLLFINAIKSEVILTFLGLGLKEGASWGIMISHSQSEVVSGFFWQIGSATVLMLILVLAFNVVSDALQDAFDPKHVG